jgi:hypothetical protein
VGITTAVGAALVLSFMTTVSCACAANLGNVIALAATIAVVIVPVSLDPINVPSLAGTVVPLTLVVLESAAGICAAVAVPLISVKAGCVDAGTPLVLMVLIH